MKRLQRSGDPEYTKWLGEDGTMRNFNQQSEPSMAHSALSNLDSMQHADHLEIDTSDASTRDKQAWMETESGQTCPNLCTSCQDDSSVSMSGNRLVERLLTYLSTSSYSPHVGLTIDLGSVDSLSQTENGQQAKYAHKCNNCVGLCHPVRSICNRTFPLCLTASQCPRTSMQPQRSSSTDSSRAHTQF